MSDSETPVAPSQVAAGYVDRIDVHLVRLARGHDPMGHLFAIERLARVARAERWEAQRQAQPGRSGR